MCGAWGRCARCDSHVLLLLLPSPPHPVGVLGDAQASEVLEAFRTAAEGRSPTASPPAGARALTGASALWAQVDRRIRPHLQREAQRGGLLPALEGPVRHFAAVCAAAAAAVPPTAPGSPPTRCQGA